jgi:hypothetical protein
LDGCVTVETEVNKVVVLTHDVSCGTGKVEGVGFFCPSKVMEFEFEMFGKLMFVTPNNPSNTRIHKTVFMSGSILDV